MSTAMALIIGDEILSGKVLDQNSHTLARILFDCGVKLLRIETISDDVDEIASCLQRMSKLAQYVFTSGGIGPTHDDKTYEAVAKAFDRKLIYHEPTLQGLKAHLGAGENSKPLNEARMKMALLPTPCETIPTLGVWMPLVVVENIYILPGVPKLFEYMLEGAKTNFVGQKFTRELLYTQKSEGDIAVVLAQVQEAYPGVAIGSYPRYDSPDYRVMVSIEGRDADAVKQAAADIESGFNI